MQERELITYQEAATLLGLPRGTVYAMVHQNRLPYVRMGRRLVRFRRTQLLAWIDAHQVDPSAAADAPEGL